MDRGWYTASMHTLPPDIVLYQAFIKRDPEFEGLFYAAVKTTGIFCRPTCTARKPKRENIQFFPTIEDAILAGFRACKRCHPLDWIQSKPDLVERLTQMIEQTPSTKISNQDLIAMNIEPSTARRQFQRVYGMTFQSYQRAQRMGSALHEIQHGSSVLSAQIDHGFASASGFWEAFKQFFGTAPNQAGTVRKLMVRWIDTPLGGMVAMADDEGLHLLEFVNRRGLEAEMAAVRQQLSCTMVPGNHPILEQIEKELRAYFLGDSFKFSVPLVEFGTPFELSVWDGLKRIPPGETWSYAQLAAVLGNPAATRAVGHANGKNRLAIIVPCHRVIRSDGDLCGYAGGVWRKQWLLDHERSESGTHYQPTLF